jgi:MoaA/NifB/PqqE/SkfB family radical SAM enzyme
MKALNYLKFSKNIFYKKNAMPLYFVFFVTDHCEAKCKHCLLGDNHGSTDELTLDEIEKFSETMSPILFLLLTGGDPFLRDDLYEIVNIFYRNNRTANLGMPTNGFTTTKVVEVMEKVLENFPDMDTAIDISIDGIGEDHDNIRGVPGLFDKAVWTYKELEKLTKKFPNFNLNVAVTVSKFNEDKLLELYDYLKKELKVKTINQLLTRGSPRVAEAGDVDMKKYDKFCSLLERDTRLSELPGYGGYPFSDLVNSMKNIRQKIISDIVTEKRRKIPCYAGKLSCVMFSKGDVYPCELLSESIGNIRDFDYDFKALWRCETAGKIRRMIDSNGCYCTYECFLTHAILFNLKMYPEILREWTHIKLGKMKRKSG